MTNASPPNVHTVLHKAYTIIAFVRLCLENKISMTHTTSYIADENIVSMIHCTFLISPLSSSLHTLSMTHTTSL